MPVFRLLFVGDEHLADISPANRKPGYRDDILAKECEILEIAVKRQVNAVVHSGDIFHIKSPSRVSHSLVSSLIDIWGDFKTNGISNLLVIGNHDLSNDSMDSIDRQPINTLIEAEVARPIPEAESLYIAPNIAISAIYGYGNPDSGDRQRYHMARKSPNDLLIKATHSALFPKGFKLPGKAEFSTLDQLIGHGPDIFLAGHIHDYFGITEEQGKYLVMPGSLSRGSLPEIKADRKICVVLLTINSREDFKFEEIPIKSAKPVKDVFSIPLSELKKAVSSESSLDKYMEFIRTSSDTLDSWTLKNDIMTAMNVGVLSKEISDYLISACESVNAR